MKRILLLYSILILCLSLYSGNVDRSKAGKVALNWYRHYAPASKKQANVTRSIPYRYNGRDCFYIFSFDKGGFVLVSANDAVTPVLGYGFDHAVPDSVTNEAVKGWFDYYSRQVDTAFILNLQQDAAVSKWDDIMANRFSPVTGDSVRPLLTTTWNQIWPYNGNCVANPDGPGGHAMAGCVSVALAQIFKYHSWPLRAGGKVSYISNACQEPDSISIDYSQQPDFLWDSMPDVVETYNNEVAKLINSTGTSVGSQYGANSTGVAFYYIGSEGIVIRKTALEIILPGFFNYNYDSLTTHLKGYDSVWFMLLKKDLNKGLPIYYRGGNHAWVCDGYDNSNLFHFNFGWGGSYDGYYSVNNIAPGTFNFNSFQVALTGIQPDPNSIYLYHDTTLSGNTIANGNIIIPRGEKLHLNPGTTLKMGPGSRILSLGTLVSSGLSDNQNTITALDTTLGWKGLYFNDDYLWGFNALVNTDSSVINYTEISWSAEDGVNAFGMSGIHSALSLNGCIIRNNKGLGLKSFSNFLYLRNSTFYDNGTLAWEDVNIGYPYALIEHNTFKKTLLLIAMSGHLEFNNNLVINNSRLHLSASNDGVFNLKKNIFYGNDRALSVDFSGANFINNLFVNNNSGLYIQTTWGSHVNNNTFANNITGLEINNMYGSFAPDSLSNNLLFNNRVNLSIQGDTKPFVSHCLIQNGLKGIVNQTPYGNDQMPFDSIFDGKPWFINPGQVIGYDTGSISHYSYNISGRSAAIDRSGTDTTGLLLPPTDLDFNPRSNRRTDIGAYESIYPVDPAPAILMSPLDQTLCSGRDIVLSTFVRGDSLHYSWVHNSVNMLAPDNDSLFIPNSTLNDAGTYYCVVCNELGCDTTQTARVTITSLPPVELGQIQGPDSVTWWQKSVNYCVQYQANTNYSWDILGHQSSFPAACRNFMAGIADSSGLIKVTATNICSQSDSVEKQIVIVPFSPPEPYGILTGPSVVHKRQMVDYLFDRGNFDIDHNFWKPAGFEWRWANSYIGEGYTVSTYAASQLTLEVFWYKWDFDSTGYHYYSGEHIILPIKVVDSANQLPSISGPDSVNLLFGNVVYSIDSLTPATSYEWVLPAGMNPSGGTNGRTINVSTNSDFTGGVLQVRGVNPNWRGPYYDKNIYKAVNTVPVELNLTHDTTIVDGQQTCFNATQTITVAGSGNSFAVQPGGSATMIAGQNIVMFPATTVKSGGYLKGYIAPSGPWCLAPALPSVTSVPFIADDKSNPDTENNGFRVYPNPTTGDFTIEISANQSVTPVKLECYNLMGSLMLKKMIMGVGKLHLSLGDREPGIYMVRVTGINCSGYQKILKIN